MAENSAWTQELKDKVVKRYKDSKPTPENTGDLVEEIANDIGKTIHGVRMILIKEGEYVKVTQTSGTSSGTSNSDKPKRVSKQDSIDALEALLESQAIEIDSTITSKMTGKAAAWFTNVITEIIGEEVEED